MLKRLSILCPVDFSERSRQALRWAATVLQHHGGDLTVLTVVDPLLASAAGIQFGIDLIHQETHPGLRAFVEETLPESVRVTLRPSLQAVIGDPSKVIVQTSRLMDARLIVMGSHGRGALRTLLLGSTTQKVLHKAACPVLIVPAGAVARGDDLDGRLRKILLATDFGPSATAATHWAIDIAAEMRVPLVFTHVVEPVLVPSVWQALIDDLDEERVASGERMLARLSRGVQDVASEQVVTLGHPAQKIARLARERGADLVVMGLASGGGATPQVPGSIAYKVLSTAHIAVVVVPVAGHPAGQSAGAGPESPAVPAS